MVSKPNCILLPGVEPIPILYEDRAVLAIDKPRGWMLVPFSWQKTSRNLQAAIVSSIAAGDFWARSRGLRFLRYVHRLDAATTGVMLFAKNPGAVESYSKLFESRRVEKVYLAVVAGRPKQGEWTCRLKLAPDARHLGRMKADPRRGKAAETRFRVLTTNERRAAVSAAAPVPPTRPGDSADERAGSQRVAASMAALRSLIEARPFTGRTHQIRVHLAESGLPVVGDDLYGQAGGALALRAVGLSYTDPFTQRRVEIRAPIEEFCREYGFEIPPPTSALFKKDCFTAPSASH
jgi:23S rRNA pseudouridine1911/1915/1917 synthase